MVQLQGYLAGEPMDATRPESRLQWLSSQSLPKVPIDVAATGPAVIAVGAQLAERLTFNVGADETRLAWAIAQARAVCEQHGRAYEDLSLGAYVSVVPHPDRLVAQDLAKGVVAAYAHFSAMPGHPADLLDPADADIYQALGDGTRDPAMLVRTQRTPPFYPVSSLSDLRWLALRSTASRNCPGW